MNATSRKGSWQGAVAAAVVAILGVWGLVHFALAVKDFNTGVRHERVLRTRSLAEAMKALDDHPDIEWYRTVDNHVVLGFRAWPEDGAIVVNGVARYVSDAVSGVWTVFAIDAHPGPRWPASDEWCHALATARAGQLTETIAVDRHSSAPASAAMNSLAAQLP